MTDSSREAAGAEGGDVQGDNTGNLMNFIANDVIGESAAFLSPYGRRRVVYADYTASGRSMKSIEAYIQKEVLPYYGNTHTTTTVTSLQSTRFRQEAKDIIRNATNSSEEDVIIFSGSGSTAAAHILVHALHVKIIADANPSSPPVVFVGPYEHHSNICPWRDAGAVIERIQQNTAGLVDLDDLRLKLEKYKHAPLRIGAFAAASNVTGILSDTVNISRILHEYDAVAIWDYATAGPYVPIDMNPSVTEHGPISHKDAVILSPHKFVGGVGCPGLLIAKKALFEGAGPYRGGGGSVFYVKRDSHRYFQDIEMREEGGTPDIVGSIRAGLVFQLKASIPRPLLHQQETNMTQRGLELFNTCPQLILLGSNTADRLAIFSFMIKHPQSGMFLHHNYVCALLNDLFGVQARGGCACAGPYAQDIMGIDPSLADRFETLLLEDLRLDRRHLRRQGEYSPHEILRPGFARFNLPFFMPETEVEFVLKAVRWVAENGWKLLPEYTVNTETAHWTHESNTITKERRWLGHVSYKSGSLEYSVPKPVETLGHTIVSQTAASFDECFQTANAAIEAIQTRRRMTKTLPVNALSAEAEKLRWFLLPAEALTSMNDKDSSAGAALPPFVPPSYNGNISDSDNANVDPIRLAKQTRQSKEEEISFLRAENERLVSLLSEKISTNGLHGVTSTNDGIVVYTRRDSGDSGSVSGTIERIMPYLATSVVAVSAAIFSIGYERQSVVSSTAAVVSAAVVAASALVYSEYKQTRTQGVSSKDSPSSSVTPTSAGASSTPSKPSDVPEVAPQQPRSHPKKPKSDNNQLDQTKISSVIKPATKAAEKVALDSTPKGQADSKSQQPKSLGRVRPAIRFHSPPKSIMSPMFEGIDTFKMLEDGDRVLVCVSGGKDSLSMLHALKQAQYYYRAKGISFEIGAATVDPGTAAFDPSPLKEYMAALGVPYFYESACIIDTASDVDPSSICSFCSRMKRGILYGAARREGYNVLALGQHLDDMAESMLMSIFFNGRLRTMKANYITEDGDLRVIRPLALVREYALRSFAEDSKVRLPVISENCPGCFEAPQERHRMKQLLASLELTHPILFNSVRQAMMPLMAIKTTDRGTILLEIGKDTASSSVIGKEKETKMKT